MREKAVAIKYDDLKDNAPKVVAKGQGVIAQKIKELAQAQGIPIHRDDDLIELLAQVDINREIPPELFTAVAEILAWLYRANDVIKKENDQ